MVFLRIKTRRNKREYPTEAQEAKLLMQSCWRHPNMEHREILREYLIHIPNGGSRHMLEAKNLKAQGVKAGVSDYFLAYPLKGYHGLWIELKRVVKAKPVVSKTQKEWLARTEGLGYKGVIAYGAQDALDKINEYLRPDCEEN